jgi:uncharacterized membrane protein YtjA (UPF0391 family)
MLKWAVIFLIIAIVAGLFGFTGVEQASATIAQWLFGIFLVLFLGALVIGLAIGSQVAVVGKPLPTTFVATATRRRSPPRSYFYWCFN